MADRRIVLINVFNFLTYTTVTGARVVYTLLALELGAGSLEVGIITGGMQVALVLFSIPVIAAAERWGVRALLITGAACGATSLVLPVFFTSLPVVMVSALLFGMWNVLTFQPTQKLVGAFSRPEDRARNFSAYAFVAGTTILFGPFIAGVSIDAIGHVAALLVFLPLPLVAIGLLLLRGKSLAVRGKADADAPRMRETLADPVVWKLIAVSSVSAMAFELYPFFLPLHGHAAGLSASTIGAIISAAAFGSLSLPLVLPQLVRRAGEERVMAACLALCGIVFALTPFTVNPWVLGFLSFLYGVGIASSIPVTAMMAYAMLSQVKANHFLGLRNLGNGVTRVLAPPVFGGIAAVGGLAMVFWIAAASMGVASVWQARKPRG